VVAAGASKCLDTGQCHIGRFPPGSELARERKGSVPAVYRPSNVKQSKADQLSTSTTWDNSTYFASFFHRIR